MKLVTFSPKYVFQRWEEIFSFGRKDLGVRWRRNVGRISLNRLHFIGGHAVSAYGAANSVKNPDKLTIMKKNKIKNIQLLSCISTIQPRRKTQIPAPWVILRIEWPITSRVSPWWLLPVSLQGMGRLSFNPPLSLPFFQCFSVFPPPLLTPPPI